MKLLVSRMLLICMISITTLGLGYGVKETTDHFSEILKGSLWCNYKIQTDKHGDPEVYAVGSVSVIYRGLSPDGDKVVFKVPRIYSIGEIDFSGGKRKLDPYGEKFIGDLYGLLFNRDLKFKVIDGVSVRRHVDGTTLDSLAKEKGLFLLDTEEKKLIVEALVSHVRELIKNNIFAEDFTSENLIYNHEENRFYMIDLIPFRWCESAEDSIDHYKNQILNKNWSHGWNREFSKLSSLEVSNMNMIVSRFWEKPVEKL